jgi:hypothetical protein
MVSKATLCLLFLACGVIGAAWADEADGVVGQWLTEDSDARFQIYKEGGEEGGTGQMRRHLIEGEAGGVSQGERDVSV